MAGKVEQGIRENLRIKRQALSEAEQVNKELDIFEQTQLKPAEESIVQAEESYRGYQEEKKAYSNAQDFYEKGVPLSMVSGREYKYLKEMYKNKELAKQSFISELDNIREKNPNVQFDIDWSNLSARYSLPEERITTISPSTLPGISDKVIVKAEEIDKPKLGMFGGETISKAPEEDIFGKSKAR